jgi:hypothetical protein
MVIVGGAGRPQMNNGGIDADIPHRWLMESDHLIGEVSFGQSFISSLVNQITFFAQIHKQ